MTRKNVLAMGTVAMDLVFECEDLPKDDGFAKINHEILLPGGSSANMLVSLVSLGVGAYQTGKVGDDIYGTAFRRSLIEAGVSDRFLITKADGSTLRTYIFTTPDARHSIFANVGDCVMNLEAEDLDQAILDRIDVFYTDMFSARASLYLGKKAKEKGIPVVYNMQCEPRFMESLGVKMAEIEEMISLSDLFVSGRDGYYTLTGRDDYMEGIKEFQDKFHIPLGSICTAGSEGAIWYDNGVYLQYPAYDIEAIDTTGAGDCFLGGLIYKYFCDNSKREDALQFGAALAAIKCMQKGPRIKTSLEEVYKFINACN